MHARTLACTLAHSHARLHACTLDLRITCTALWVSRAKCVPCFRSSQSLSQAHFTRPSLRTVPASPQDLPLPCHSWRGQGLQRLREQQHLWRSVWEPPHHKQRRELPPGHQHLPRRHGRCSLHSLLIHPLQQQQPLYGHISMVWYAFDSGE